LSNKNYGDIETDIIMKKIIVVTAIVALCITILSLFCFKKPLTEQKLIEIYGDVGVLGMEGYLNSFVLPEDANVRGQLALQQWKNDKIDPKPILVFAEISKREGRPTRLNMYFSDEDKDVMGFRIREEHFVAEGKSRIIEETYPAFVHLSPPTVWACIFEIELRTEGKRKDENLWQAYINKNENDPIEVKPPIAVSLPEPNCVDVWVWVYDRAGNQSEPVKAVTAIKSKDSGENADSIPINRRKRPRK
jgi:hypothetical protein